MSQRSVDSVLRKQMAQYHRFREQIAGLMEALAARITERLALAR